MHRSRFDVIREDVASARGPRGVTRDAVVELWKLAKGRNDFHELAAPQTPKWSRPEEQRSRARSGGTFVWLVADEMPYIMRARRRMLGIPDKEVLYAINGLDS